MGPGMLSTPPGGQRTCPETWRRAEPCVKTMQLPRGEMLEIDAQQDLGSEC